MLWAHFVADHDPPPERLFFGTSVGGVWWQAELPLEAARGAGGEIPDERSFYDWPYEDLRGMERAIARAVARSEARPPFVTLVAEDFRPVRG